MHKATKVGWILSLVLACGLVVYFILGARQEARYGCDAGCGERVALLALALAFLQALASGLICWWVRRDNANGPTELSSLNARALHS